MMAAGQRERPTCGGEATTALFAGAQRRTILQLIDRIAELASRWVRAYSSPATPFADGASGLALFLGYYGWFAGRDDYVSIVMDLLAVCARSDVMTRPWFYSGASGLSWVATHLARVTGRSDFACDDLGVRHAIVDHLATVPSSALHGRHELMRGLTGVGIYALEWPDDELKERCLSLLLTHLTTTAIIDNVGVYWALRAPGSKKQTKYVNLGPAHGLLGPLGFLARLAVIEPFASQARPLVENGIRWLLSVLACQGDISVEIPGWAKTAEGRVSIQSGWCNGDNGIAACVATLGRLLQHAELYQHAADLSVRASRNAEHIVQDACLCHGAAGMAHLLNRVRVVSARHDVEEAARYWYEKTLQHLLADESLRFMHGDFDHGDPPLDWNENMGFLSGVAGIGLTLLSSIADSDLQWDRALLLSA